MEETDNRLLFLEILDILNENLNAQYF